MGPRYPDAFSSRPFPGSGRRNQRRCVKPTNGRTSLKSSIRLYATALLAILVLTVPVLSMGCGSKSGSPAEPTPTPTPTPTPAPGLAAPTAVSPGGGAQLDTLHPKLQIKNSVPTGTVGTVTYRFEWSETDQFPADSRTGFKDGVPEDASGTTTFEI